MHRGAVSNKIGNAIGVVKMQMRQENGAQDQLIALHKLEYRIKSPGTIAAGIDNQGVAVAGHHIAVGIQRADGKGVDGHRQGSLL